MRKKYTKGPITLAELVTEANIKHSLSGCMEWQGAIARNGYGMVRRGGRAFTVTRLMMHFVHGFDLKSELHVLHRCDNPRCVNTAHLFLGTTQDNIKDKVNKDRHNRGRRVWKARLCDDDVREIFRLYNVGLNPNQIAKRYNIQRSSIYLILQRKAWKHVQVDKQLTNYRRR